MASCVDPVARLAAQDVDDVPAPNRWPVRKTAESAFCAASVASQVAIGSRQVSQLPHEPGSSSPK